MEAPSQLSRVMPYGAEGTAEKSSGTQLSNVTHVCFVTGVLDWIKELRFNSINISVLIAFKVQASI